MELQEAPGERKAARYKKESYPGSGDCQGRGRLGVPGMATVPFCQSLATCCLLGRVMSNLSCLSRVRKILSFPRSKHARRRRCSVNPGGHSHPRLHLDHLPPSHLEVFSHPTLQRPLLKEGSSHCRTARKWRGKQLTDSLSNSLSSGSA